MANKRPFMPLYVADYLVDTEHLTAEEHGAYLLLLMAMWNAGGKLPNSDDVLIRLARIAPRRWGHVRKAILPFFFVENGKLSHRRIARELRKTAILENIEKSRSDTYQISDLSVAQIEGQATDFVNGKPENRENPARARDAPACLHPVDSTYPKSGYVESGSDFALTPEASKPKKPKLASFPFADDWIPDRRFRSEAIRLGLPENRIVAVGESWRDHHKSRGNQFVDWLAAWRKWVRNEIEWSKQQVRPHFATGPPDEGQAFRALLRRKAEGN